MIHTVTEHTLSTGTQGLLIDVPGSSVVNIKLYFRAGYQFGDFAKYEAPHLIEHHVLNATKGYPAKNRIMTEFRLNGAYNNAFTNPYYISYIAECADFEVERILGLLTEVVARPLFPPEYYETERENVRTELTRYLSDYGRQASMLAAEASYPKLVMDYRQRLAQLDSITHDDVVGHYHATHTARNANFVVTGAIASNEAVILKQLEQLYGELPVGELKQLRDDIGLGLAEPLSVKEKIDSIYFHISWFEAGLNLPQRAAGRLLASILTGGFSSRIYGKARDEGLTYHISSAQDVSRKASEYTFTGFCNPSKWERLLEVIGSEAQMVVENGPTTDELEAARHRLIGAITLGSQTAGDISNWYASYYVRDGEKLSYDDYFALLNKVKVEDVQAMAKHYFSSKRHNATLVGKVGESENSAVAGYLKPIWH
jgi:zinc protease